MGAREAMPLHELIRACRDEVIATWTQRMSQHAPVESLPQSELVDHLPFVLERLADMAESGEAGARARAEEVSARHAMDRVRHGFALEELMLELSVLRDCVFDCWEREVAGSIPLAELRAFDAALDVLIRQSTSTYVQARAAARDAASRENARLVLEAERAVRQREELLAVVSHDLRNPLSAVHMSAALLLRRSAGDPKMRKQVETILRAASRMEHLIGDLLDMASIQKGRLAVEPVTQPIGPILAEAVETAEPLARANGQSFASEIAVGQVRCAVDRERLLQLLSNLLDNARKFTPAGGEIRLSAVARDQEVECTIRDSGPGIAAEHLPHVFDPYWSARGKRQRGIGLGLYISKGIVEAHRGRIWIDPGGPGTSVHFALPRTPD